MSIPCIGEECVARCVRWDQVNSGQPIKYFHDTSNYMPGAYQGNINDPTPENYLAIAMSLWENEYRCGSLFERVDSLAEAQLHIFYPTRTAENLFLGQALCVCDEDDVICEKQILHDTIFAAPIQNTGLQQQTIRMFMDYGPNARNFSENLFINILAHELGHILGMGHVYGLGIDSVMAETDLEIVRLYGFDVQQLDLRHPCCALPEIILPLQSEPALIDLSDRHCPVCQAIAL